MYTGLYLYYMGCYVEMIILGQGKWGELLTIWPYKLYGASAKRKPSVRVGQNECNFPSTEGSGDVFWKWKSPLSQTAILSRQSKTQSGGWMRNRNLLRVSANSVRKPAADQMHNFVGFNMQFREGHKARTQETWMQLLCVVDFVSCQITSCCVPGSVAIVVWTRSSHL